jgi:hypothetical protein
MRCAIGALVGMFGARLLAFCWILSGLAVGAAATAQTSEAVVEGRALVGPEGLAATHEMATRHALARTAESLSAKVSAQTGGREDVAFETVRQGDDGRGAPVCEKAYINRLLVTGFAFEFPEQWVEEWDGRLLPRVNGQRIEALTAIELARALERDRHVRAVFDGDVFPYASPSRAPLPYLPTGSLETPVVALARERQTQYVLSGIYRGFGLEKTPPWHKRLIEIEAFLHDGANGAVLARQRFQTEVSGMIRPGDAFSVFNTPAIGTRAFQKTSFGGKWTALIEDIARWAGAQASCLPFIARVMKVEGHLLQLDAGAESRMTLGDTLMLYILRQPPVFDLSAHLLGQEKQMRATVSLRAVYPAFSIAELIEMPDELTVAPGDLVYTQ